MQETAQDHTAAGMDPNTVLLGSLLLEYTNSHPPSCSHLRAGALPDTDNPVLVGVEHLAHLRVQQTRACTRQQWGWYTRNKPHKQETPGTNWHWH